MATDQQQDKRDGANAPPGLRQVPGSTPVKPSFRGRYLVLAGILLMAFSMRLAVAGVSPLVSLLAADLPFTAASIGVLGMLPTAGFAVMGFATPQLMRRWELEPLLLASLLAAAAGQLGRALAPTVPGFLGFSMLTMVGLGLGNIVLPPLIKRYFPDRVGLLTALYVTLFAVSTALTPQLAIPLADVGGWRFSVGIWSAVSLLAALPWILMHRRWRGDGARRRPAAAAVRTAAHATSMPEGPARMRIWRSPVAWGLALVFGGCSSNTFAMFTWLPPLLVDSGMCPGAAGAVLAQYAITALPTSLIVPLLVARLRRPLPLAFFFVVMFAAGYLGLMLSPASGTWLWVTLAGLGQGAYSFALLMINLRTRTTAGSGALSGFAQGVGYSLACLGALLFGLLHDISGGWPASFGLLGALLLVLAAGLLIVSRPRMLEDGPQTTIRRRR